MELNERRLSTIKQAAQFGLLYTNDPSQEAEFTHLLVDIEVELAKLKDKKTIVHFRMQKNSKIETVKFIEQESDQQIDEYFEQQCGGVYTWWRRPNDDLTHIPGL